MFGNRVVPLFVGLGLLNSVIAFPQPEHSLKQCSQIELPEVPGVKIVTVEGTERRNFTVPALLPLLLEPIPDLSVCEVQVALTHPGMEDNVHVTVWLPLK